MLPIQGRLTCLFVLTALSTYLDRLSTPACHPRLWARSVLDSLVLDPSREPIFRCRARIKAFFWRALDSLRDDFAFLHECTKDHRISWAHEEYQRPALKP